MSTRCADKLCLIEHVLANHHPENILGCQVIRLQEGNVGERSWYAKACVFSRYTPVWSRLSLSRSQCQSSCCELSFEWSLPIYETSQGDVTLRVSFGLQTLNTHVVQTIAIYTAYAWSVEVYYTIRPYYLHVHTAYMYVYTQQQTIHTHGRINTSLLFALISVSLLTWSILLAVHLSALQRFQWNRLPTI